MMEKILSPWKFLLVLNSRYYYRIDLNGRTVVSIHNHLYGWWYCNYFGLEKDKGYDLSSFRKKVDETLKLNGYELYSGEKFNKLLVLK